MSYDTTIVADAPTSFWKLLDASGTTAADSADTNPGTYTGGFTLGSFGIGDAEASVTLDGTSGYVSVPSAANLHPASVSAEVVVWPRTIQNQVGLIIGNNYPGSGAIGYALGFNPSTTGTNTYPQFGSFDGSAWHLANATSAVKAQFWHHLVGTYDGTNVKLYVDGTLVATTAWAGPIVYQAQPFYIGRDWNANRFDGKIAKAAVYPVALTAAQVTAHFNAVPLPTNIVMQSGGFQTTKAAAVIATGMKALVNPPAQPVGGTVVVGSGASIR